ncbi:MAG: tetratricopeptide repeat protein [Planctomyces sp.]
MKCAENKSRLCRLRFAGNGRFSWLLVCFCLVSAGTAAQDAPAKPAAAAGASEPDVASRKRIEQLNTEARAEAAMRLEKFPQPAEGQPGTVALWSARGDADMFLGNFVSAEAAYRKMVELDPELDASHWRLGIACFFADHAKAGADQFEKYHSFDSVDRENGIWRYFCHHRADGREKARQQLLRYEKDDRPPFREVYQLFQGSLTAAAVIAAAESGAEETQAQRQFYSYLYVGLNASLEGDRKLAEATLSKAVLNDWGRRAGYGPNYMWHVGRLELNRLQSASSRPAP